MVAVKGTVPPNVLECHQGIKPYVVLSLSRALARGPPDKCGAAAMATEPVTGAVLKAAVEAFCPELAGLVADKYADLARALVNAGMRVLARRVHHPQKECMKCNRDMQLCTWRTVTAAVLDVDGWRQVEHVARRCRNAKCSEEGVYIWYNFCSRTLNGKECHFWHWVAGHELAYFFLTQNWGVTTAWLRQFTQRLVRHFASFTGEAAVHRAAALRVKAAHIVPQESQKKLKRAWFAWRVVVRSLQYFAEKGRAIDASFLDLSVGAHEIAAKVSVWYESYMLSRRVRLANGSLKLVVFDGSAKLRRWRVCGRALAKMMECPILGKFTAISCPETRAPKRKFCASHCCLPAAKRICGKTASLPIVVAHRKPQALTDTAGEGYYEVALVESNELLEQGAAAVRRWERADAVCPRSLQQYWSGVVLNHFPNKAASADLDSVSCQTSKERSSGQSMGRVTGGWLVACLPSGYILHMKEYFGAESLSQRYFFLAELREAVPDLRIIVHDDACHVRKFATARAGDSAAATALAYPQMHYIMDKLHSSGHTDAWCLSNCHPDLPENAEMLGQANTSICEQTFRVTNRFKYMVQHMHQATCNIFVHEIGEARNALLRA
jgi:hypothetical protein